LVPPSKKGALGKLLGSDTRAELLTFFHSNPRTADSLEGLAARVGRKPSEIENDLTELVEIGLLREQKIYSLDPDRDVTLQREISDELKETTAQQEQEPLEEVTRELTGIEIIDHIVPSGIPSPVMLLIMGDPGTAKRELCLEFVAKWLRQKRRVVYLTLEQSPEEIRASLSEMGDLGPLVGPLARPERVRDLVMIDCYSPQIGMTSNEELSADPNNLSELSIAVSKALENRTQGLFLLDSLDTLIRKRGLASSLELIRTLRAKTRIVKFDSIVTLNRQAFPTAILAAVQESADGVFEMKVQEEPSGLTRYFRVPKMRGTSHHSAWRAYELDFKTHARKT
jgi:KaiC/GvpD/RAD55 family RecA-like ATPase